MIEFRLEGRSGIAPYLQIVQQVKHALRLGMLRTGDGGEKEKQRQETAGFQGHGP